MRVVVIMSTYQGERFVKEQLASIVSQLPEEGRLLIRDDGSRDRTCKIIDELNEPRITLVRGENIGFARSFFWLLAAVPNDAELVMLSDQDDIWLPGKIERAWQALQGQKDSPTLYCSRMQLVDEDLKPIGVSPVWPRGASFANALAENIVTGCTIALNRPAMSLVLNVGDVHRIYFHDWWIYLVVSAFGKVILDQEPTILYRQHGNNAIGRGVGLKRYLMNLSFVRKKSWVHIMFNQIENFRLTHAETLPVEKKRLLDENFNPNRMQSMIKLLCSPHRYRQFLRDDLLFRLLVLSEILTGRGLLPK